MKEKRWQDTTTGNVISSKHHFSYVKDHLADCWYKFNDHRVKKFKNKVDKIIEEGVGDNNRSAYFLVYINEKHILPKKTKKVNCS